MKKDVMAVKDVLRDPSRGPSLCERGEGPITAETPAAEPQSHAEAKLTDHLLQLVPHTIMADEDDGAAPPSQEESRIPCQEDPPLALRKGDKPTVLGIAEIERVVSQDAKPLGQPAQHAVRDEAHLPRIHGRNSSPGHDDNTPPRS
jgi:hypothetical protein